MPVAKKEISKKESREAPYSRGEKTGRRTVCAKKKKEMDLFVCSNEKITKKHLRKGKDADTSDG